LQQQLQQHQRPHSTAAAASDTPRSAAGSWTSALSAAAGSLPQTEEVVQQLDLGEVECLTEEAAELQARAVTALRLARQRLRRRERGGQAGQQWQQGAAPPGGRRGGAVSGAAPVRAALQLYMLALAEAALLSGAGLVARLSLGRVSLPTGVMLAPLAVARRAAFVLLAAADLLLRVLGALCGLPAGGSALAAG
jgi:hypothetical protein